jgi:hypothetical protein
MTKLIELQDLGRVKIAFDRAGTSTASKDDEKKFRSAEILQQSGEWDTAKELILGTKWFQAYTGGVKKFLSAEAQGFDDTQVIICIDGGTVTQVEQQEMSRILAEATADAKKSGVVLRTRMQTMSYCEFLRRFAQPAAAPAEQRKQAAPAQPVLADLCALQVSRGQADEALMPGTRLRVPKHGEGVYERFKRCTVGANDHYVRFDSGGGTKKVALKKLKPQEWSVLGGERLEAAAKQRVIEEDAAAAGTAVSAFIFSSCHMRFPILLLSILRSCLSPVPVCLQPA